MPKVPDKKLVNRTAVGTYQGKLHQRSSGAYGGGKAEAGKRKQGKPKAEAQAAPVGKVNDVQCDGEVVDVASLTPDPLNARLHPDRNLQAIMDSLALYGQRKPVVVRKQTRVVVAGNGTLEAAKALGWTKIAASIRPMTDEEALGYGLADNRTAELAKWDFEVVARLDRLMAEAGDSKMVGWTNEELQILRLKEFTPQSPADDVPEAPVAAITKLGDLWTLGDHRLLCGDSTDPKEVKRLMGKDRASLVFTDPPYGVAIAAKNRLLNSVQKAGRCLVDIQDDTITPDDLKARLLPAFVNLREIIMADDCTVFVCSPQGGELCMMMMMMMTEAGLRPRHVLIWKKNAPTFSMGRLDYDYQHEPILMTWLKRHKRPLLGQHRTSVWEVDKPRASAHHPTMKPVELVVNALENNSDKLDVVADIYLGSGTTLIAAQQTHRKCRGLEIDPRYCDVTLTRWAEFTGLDPVRQDGKKWSQLKKARKE